MYDMIQSHLMIQVDRCLNVTNHRNSDMYDSRDTMNDNYDASIKISLREVSRWNI